MSKGKIYPHGMYDGDGNIHPVLRVSRGFASNLHEDFINIPEDMVSCELRTQFAQYSDTVKYHTLSGLGSDDYIRRGYCLKSDILKYMQSDNDYWSKVMDDLVRNMIPENIFAMKALNEINQHGSGNEHPCSEYQYFCFPDHTCREYEVSVLTRVAAMFDLAYWDQDTKIVILETEG